MIQRVDCIIPIGSPEEFALLLPHTPPANRRKDTISSSLIRPIRPAVPIRCVLSAALATLHASLWLFHLGSCLTDFLCGADSQKTIFLKLHDLADNQDEARSFMEQVSRESTDPSTQFLMIQFLALPEIHPHLGEILRGANVRLQGDQGRYFRTWSAHESARPRTSSHLHLPNECYEIGHLLFYLDLEGHTRMQFENSPLNSCRNWVYHTLDYLYHLRDGEQIGVAGTSPHVESRYLDVSINSLG